MKNILVTILSSFVFNFCFSQAVVVRTTGTVTNEDMRWMAGKNMFMPRYADTTAANLDLGIDSAGAQIYTYNTKSEWIRQSGPKRWVSVANGGSSTDSLSGGPITTIPIVSTNPGSNLSIQQWLINTFYGSQAPLVTISGGGIFEYTSASTLSTTLNWSATRQTGTGNLARIKVAGINQSFTNPPINVPLNGNQSITITTNTLSSYSITAVAVDSSSASASTSFTYEGKMYLGFCAHGSGSVTDNDLLTATGGTVGGTFSTNYIVSQTTLINSTSKYVVFAYPASFGPAISIKVNGLNITYNVVQRSVINASGFTQSYYIYSSPYPTSSNVTIQVSTS